MSNDNVTFIYIGEGDEPFESNELYLDDVIDADDYTTEELENMDEDVLVANGIDIDAIKRSRHES